MSYAAEHRLRLLTLLKRFNVNPSLPHLTTTETRKKALRQAYYQLAKQAHPDAAPDHLRDRAERNFIALHKQYEEARDLLDSVNLEEHAAGSGGPDPNRGGNTGNPFTRQTSSARAGGNRPFEDFWRYEHVDEGAYHSDANEHARRYAFYRRGAAAGSADGAQHYYWAERDPQYLPSTKIGVKDKAKGIFLTAGIALGFFLGSRAGNKRPDYYQQGVEGERPVGLTKYDSTKGGTWVDSVTGEALDARVLRSHWLEQSWSSFTGPLSDGSAPLQTAEAAVVSSPSPEYSFGETQFSQEQEPSKAESLEVYLKPTLLRLADFGLDLAGPMRDVYDRRDYFRGSRMFRRTRSDPLVVLEEEQEFIFCPEEGFRPRVPLPGGWQGETSSGFSAEAGTSKSTSSTSATQGDADHGTKTGEALDGYKESVSVGTNEPAMMSAPAGGFRVASATRQADGKERGQTPVSNGEAKVVSRKKSMPVAVQRKPSHSRSLRKKRSLKSSSAAARASENEVGEPVVRQMLDEDAVSSSSSPAQKLGGKGGVRLSATESSSNDGLQDRNRVPGGSTRESGSEQIAARDTTASPEQANPSVVWCLPAPSAAQATAEPLIIWKQVVAVDDARVAGRTSRRSLLTTAKASTDSDSGASSPEPLRRRPAASDRFVRPPRPQASDPRSEVWIITPPWYRGSVPSAALATPDEAREAVATRGSVELYDPVAGLQLREKDRGEKDLRTPARSPVLEDSTRYGDISGLHRTRSSTVGAGDCDFDANGNNSAWSSPGQLSDSDVEGSVGEGVDVQRDRSSVDPRTLSRSSRAELLKRKRQRDEIERSAAFAMNTEKSSGGGGSASPPVPGYNRFDSNPFSLPNAVGRIFGL